MIYKYAKPWSVAGWIFIRWWISALWKMQRFAWWRSLLRWMRYGTRDALVTHRLRYFLVKLLEVQEYYCPHCGYEQWSEHPDLYECTESGTYQSDYGTEHWWRGYQSCYRCGYRAPYGDST